MISRILAAISARFLSVRYFLGDLLFLVNRPFRGIGGSLSSSWYSISPQWRLRTIVAVGAVTAIALVAFVLVPNLPCAAPGGDECAPDDDAIALVPADALVYVHVNIDAGAEQAQEAATVAERTPRLT